MIQTSNARKFSRYDSRLKLFKSTDVSETSSFTIITDVEIQSVSEASVGFNSFTRLSVRENVTELFPLKASRHI
jgi:hypothetical protein